MYGDELVAMLPRVQGDLGSGQPAQSGQGDRAVPDQFQPPARPDLSSPQSSKPGSAFPTITAASRMRRRAASGSASAAARQVGDEVMCPSYLATGEEKHSTRGRAHLLHEMTRGEVIADGWDSDAVEDALVAVPRLQGMQGRLPGRRRRRDVEGRVPGASLCQADAVRARPLRWDRSTAGRSSRRSCAGARQRRLRERDRRSGRPESIRARDLPRFASRTFRDWFRERGSRAHRRRSRADLARHVQQPFPARRR